MRIELPKLASTISVQMGGQYRRHLPMLDWDYQRFLHKHRKSVIMASEFTDGDYDEKDNQNNLGPAVERTWLQYEVGQA